MKRCGRRPCPGTGVQPRPPSRQGSPLPLREPSLCRPPGRHQHHANVLKTFGNSNLEKWSGGRFETLGKEVFLIISRGLGCARREVRPVGTEPAGMTPRAAVPGTAERGRQRPPRGLRGPGRPPPGCGSPVCATGEKQRRLFAFTNRGQENKNDLRRPDRVRVKPASSPFPSTLTLQGLSFRGGCAGSPVCPCRDSACSPSGHWPPR